MRARECSRAAFWCVFLEANETKIFELVGVCNRNARASSSGHAGVGRRDGGYIMLEFSTVELQVQYRMVPSLMRATSELFYQGKLVCGRSDVKPPRGIVWPSGESTVFFDVRGEDSHT